MSVLWIRITLHGRIRIPIKVINWIWMHINMPMTSQNELLRIGSTFKGRIWIPFKLMALDPDPDPDPHQYADDKMQCCGSASLSCGSGSDLSFCCGYRS